MPESRLKDGDWKCVAYTDIQRTELTVHIKGDKVGLYDTNGKALLANGTRGHVKDERSGVKGACRPSDAAWLLEQAKAQGITDTKPLHVAEYRQENDK